MASLSPDEKKRLLHTQRSLSFFLNCSFRLINYDALDAVLRIWEEAGAPIQKLKALIDRGHPEKPLEESIGDDLLYWFYPENVPKSFQKKGYTPITKDALNNAIWQTPLSIPNPLFQAVKKIYPPISSYMTLHYLRAIASFNNINEQQELLNPINNKNEQQALLNPIGLKEMILPIRQGFGTMDGYWVVGHVWTAESLDPTEAGSHSFRMERNILAILKQIKKNEILSYEDTVHLINSLRMHSLVNQDILTKKTLIASTVITDLTLLEKQYNRSIAAFSSSEWRNLVEWLLFLHCDYTAPLFRKYSAKIKALHDDIKKTEIKSYWKKPFSKDKQEKDEKNKPYTVHISVRLSPEPRLNHVASSVWTFNHKDDLYQFRTAITKKEKHEENLDHVTIEYDDEDVTEDNREKYEKLWNDARKELESFHKLHREKGMMNRSHFKRTYSQQIHHKLQGVPIEDAQRRYEELAVASLQLTLADRVTYFKYDGPANILIPAVMDISNVFPRGMKPARNDAIWLDVASFMKTEGGNESQRINNPLYQCLDDETFISRYICDETFKPLAHLIDQTFINLRDWSHWFKKDGDYLISPIIYQGRKHGVLCLSTEKPCQFSILDRLSVINFVDTYAPELFESKLTAAHKRLNEILGEAIKTGRDRAFYEEIAEETAVLFGAGGVSLWRLSEERELVLIGKSINIQDNLLQYDMEVSGSDRFFTEILKRSNPLWIISDVSSLTGTALHGLSAAGYRSCIQVKMVDMEQRPFGLLVIHDRMKGIEYSKEFQDAVVYLGQEITEIVMHYNALNRKMATIRRVIAHDVDLAFLGIQQNVELLQKRIKQHLTPELRKNLIDISSNIKLGNALLRFITSNKIEELNIMDDEHPLLAYMFTFSLHGPMRKRIDIRSVLTSALKSREEDLKEAGIRILELDIYPADIWLPDLTLREIFKNLVDNIVKYAKRGTALEITAHSSAAHREITITNTGVALNEEATTAPEKVFDAGARCHSNLQGQDDKGEGLGLFIARKRARSFGGDLCLDYRKTKDPRWSIFSFLLEYPAWLEREENPWDS